MPLKTMFFFFFFVSIYIDSFQNIFGIGVDEETLTFTKQSSGVGKLERLSVLPGAENSQEEYPRGC